MKSNLVIIGVSTGGTRAIKSLLTGMPPINAAIVVVQHMPAFINASYVRSVGLLTEMETKLVADGEKFQPGSIYIAPSEKHLVFGLGNRFVLQDGEKVCYVKPSVDVAMLSIRPDSSRSIYGVILTGMGHDGAHGTEHLKKLGALNFAQNEETCAVFGMPYQAIETGCVDYVGSPESIGKSLVRKIGKLPSAVSPSPR